MAWSRKQVVIDGLTYGYGAYGDHVTRVGKALVAAGCGKNYRTGPGPLWTDADTANYSLYQQKLGYTGTDADGIPGPTSLHKLLAPAPAPAPAPQPSGTPAPARRRTTSGLPAPPGKIDPSQVVFVGPHDTKSGLAACQDAVRQACGYLGIPVTTAWINGMVTIALRESAYNSPQWQVNKTDSNAVGAVQADGAKFQCSRGGWQCIPQTFASNHVAGTSLNIYDRIANCAAAMRYVMRNYGVVTNGSNLASRVQQADPSRKPRGY